jgi:protein involved in polysaccharide export with SLBB domain
MRSRTISVRAARGFGLALLLILGCASPRLKPLPDPQAAPDFYRPVTEERYRIEVGDTIELRSYFEPKLSQEVTVRPDGRISLLLLDDLEVVGQTLPWLAGHLRGVYEQKLGSAELALVLTRPAHLQVFVEGEVRAPSAQPLDGSVTAVGAIEMSGGFRSTACTDEVRLLRRAEDGQLESYSIDVDAVLSDRKPDVYLRRHDLLYVDKSTIAKLSLILEQYVNRVVPEVVQLYVRYWLVGGPAPLPIF